MNETERNVARYGIARELCHQTEKTLTLLLACTSRLSDRIKSHFHHHQHHHPKHNTSVSNAKLVYGCSLSLCVLFVRVGYVAVLLEVFFFFFVRVCTYADRVACFHVYLVNVFRSTREQQQTAENIQPIYRCAVYTHSIVILIGLQKALRILRLQHLSQPIRFVYYALHVNMFVCVTLSRSLFLLVSFPRALWSKVFNIAILPLFQFSLLHWFRMHLSVRCWIHLNVALCVWWNYKHKEVSKPIHAHTHVKIKFAERTNQNLFCCAGTTNS